MTKHRWTKHRIHEASGSTFSGTVPIMLWWVAKCAAEETLQGTPLAPAWLDLFDAHLSDADSYWLRWRGDLAESAELRRAYSGLYGRFFARALMSHHLGLSRFVSLGRDGVELDGGDVVVKRTEPGDIPDWVAWDESRHRFALCEAKGSLRARDFSVGQPKCVVDGKAQIERVETKDGARKIIPLKWVAATRWATDEHMNDRPATVLWDPPADDGPYDDNTVQRYRRAITRTWLNSIARGFGWETADDLTSPQRLKDALYVRALAGSRSLEADPTQGTDAGADDVATDDTGSRSQRIVDRLESNLSQSQTYANGLALSPAGNQPKPFEGSFVTTLATRFGIRPIRTEQDVSYLREVQQRSKASGDPSLLIGLPLSLKPEAKRSGATWLDDAGIAPADDLAVFDLKSIEFKRLVDIESKENDEE